MLLSTRNLHLSGSRKLLPRWIGPCRIVERIGGAAYGLNLLPRFERLHPVLHVSLKRLYDDSRDTGLGAKLPVLVDDE